MALASTTRWMGALARTKYGALSLCSLARVPAVFTALLLLQRHPSRRNDVYNILWAVVFGFATLNILSLAAGGF
jgi:cytochrome c biogenesis protein CcdA